jgi:hypothetical protein
LLGAANRERQPAALAANEMWSMDFVYDALFDGRRLRALTVVDVFTREALAIDVDQGINGEQVVETMARISSIRGAPGTIRVDNRPEFISKALDRWPWENASLGSIREWRDAGLQSTGQGSPELVEGPTDNVLQRPPSRRVPECTLVPVAGGCPDKDRGLATGL